MQLIEACDESHRRLTSVTDRASASALGIRPSVVVATLGDCRSIEW